MGLRHSCPFCLRNMFRVSSPHPKFFIHTDEPYVLPVTYSLRPFQRYIDDTCSSFTLVLSFWSKYLEKSEFAPNAPSSIPTIFQKQQPDFQLEYRSMGHDANNARFKMGLRHSCPLCVRNMFRVSSPHPKFFIHTDQPYVLPVTYTPFALSNDTSTTPVSLVL